MGIAGWPSHQPGDLDSPHHGRDGRLPYRLKQAGGRGAENKRATDRGALSNSALSCRAQKEGASSAGRVQLRSRCAPLLPPPLLLWSPLTLQLAPFSPSLPPLPFLSLYHSGSPSFLPPTTHKASRTTRSRRRDTECDPAARSGPSPTPRPPRRRTLSTARRLSSIKSSRPLRPLRRPRRPQLPPSRSTDRGWPPVTTSAPLSAARFPPRHRLRGGRFSSFSRSSPSGSSAPSLSSRRRPGSLASPPGRSSPTEMSPHGPARPGSLHPRWPTLPPLLLAPPTLTTCSMSPRRPALPMQLLPSLSLLLLALSRLRPGMATSLGQRTGRISMMSSCCESLGFPAREMHGDTLLKLVCFSLPSVPASASLGSFIRPG